MGEARVRRKLVDSAAGGNRKARLGPVRQESESRGGSRERTPLELVESIKAKQERIASWRMSWRRCQF